jgi:hypothetical protein
MSQTSVVSDAFCARAKVDKKLKSNFIFFSLARCELSLGTLDLFDKSQHLRMVLLTSGAPRGGSRFPTIMRCYQLLFGAQRKL